ncbi:MAG TPA: SIS domain-containing protein [Anaerolineales bacterium]|nr:SIS domain-containing protein [Anaerolineales bacterium]
MTAENLAIGLNALAEARFRRTNAVSTAFFEAEAVQISLACLEMARRFQRSGRLLAFGAGNAVTDALHISVEFVHPVIVGKRALPAVALGSDLAATQGIAAMEGLDMVYTRQIEALGRPEDIAMGIDPGGQDAAVGAGLAAAAGLNMLTIALTGGRADQTGAMEPDFRFTVAVDDPDVVQETHETLYHILWELVHVFFEHKVFDDG